MADEKWTAKMVADRLREAAGTMKRIPGVQVQGYVSSWPPIIREFWDAYGWNKLQVRMGPPLPDAITRMDECMTWLHWLDPDAMRLVWLRAAGIPWKVIGRRFGIGRTTAWQRWMAALLQVATLLNAYEIKKE